MRVFMSLFVGIIAIVLAAVLIIFAVQNLELVPLQFLPYTFTGSVWAITIGAATLGFLVALLLMLPGRMAEILHDRNMAQQIEQATGEMSAAQRGHAGADAMRRESQQQSQRLQTQLRQLVNEREVLVAERDRLRAERNTFRHQLAITQFELDTAPTMAAASVTNTPTWAAPSRSAVPDEDTDAEPLPSVEGIEEAANRSGTGASLAGQAEHAEGMRDFSQDSDSYDDGDYDMDDQSPTEAPSPERLIPPENPISQPA